MRARQVQIPTGSTSRLPGGTYQLRLKGSNDDGIWNEAGTAISATVVPPFWQNGWFQGIFLLTLVGGAVGGWLDILSAPGEGTTVVVEIEGGSDD